MRWDANNYDQEFNQFIKKELYRGVKLSKNRLHVSNCKKNKTIR